MNIKQEYLSKFTRIVKDIFKYNKFQFIYLKDRNGPDFTISKKEKGIAIGFILFCKDEKKFNSEFDKISPFFELYLVPHHAKNIIIITNLRLSNEHFNKIKENYGVSIVDIGHLIYLAKNIDKFGFLEKFQYFIHIEAHDKESENTILNNQKEYVLDNIWRIKYKKPINQYLKIFKEIKPGQDDWVKYEEYCVKVIKYLFAEHLEIWDYQRKTGHYRFDLVCRIVSKQNFWALLRNRFMSEYVVFEFKNKTKEINGNDVALTISKYLNRKALRKVAILISRKGPNKVAQFTSKAAINKFDYLVLNLSDIDLIKMLILKRKNLNPSEYLFKVIDKLLLKLE